ncbi:MAG: hypothetical protein WKF73_07955 [Nocardioidaceae bacterium]
MPPRILLDPPNAVLAIGLLYLVAGGVALAERRTGRYATVALVAAAVLFVPLVLILSVSLGTVKPDQPAAAAHRSAPAVDAHRTRRPGRALVRTSRRSQHRHRRHDARLGRDRVHVLRRWSAGRRAVPG